MCSKEEAEKQVLEAVLRYYEQTRGVKYSPRTRPEKDQSEPGTYDFLCASDLQDEPELAVEITRFMESSGRRAYDKSISGVARDLRSRVDGKLPGTFHLEIVGPTKRTAISGSGMLEEEPLRYKDLKRRRVEIVNELEREILEAVRDQDIMPEQRWMIPQPIECDLIKVKDQGSSLEVVWMDYYDPDMPRNFGRGGFQAYLKRSLEKILVHKNEQLREAKTAGKLTVLVLSVEVDDPLAQFYASVDNLRAVLSRQSKQSWGFIDLILWEREGEIAVVASR